MRSVKFNNKKYYFIYLEEDSKVFDFSKKRLSKEDITRLEFKSEAEFANLLNKLCQTSSKKDYHDLQSFCEIISDNLVSKEGYPISMKLAESLCKKVNYSIVKRKDVQRVLELLETLSFKEGLSFNKIKIDYPNNLKLKNLKVKKYLMLPYGELTKEALYSLPLTLELVLKELNQG